MLETAIVKDITAKLAVFFKKTGYFWRNSNQGVFKGNNKSGQARFAFHGEKGSSDILGLIIAGGRSVAIEVKTEKAYKMKNHNLSENQVKFLERVDSLGGLAIVACSYDQVEQILLKAMA